MKGRFSEVFVFKEMPTTYKRKNYESIDANGKIWKRTINAFKERQWVSVLSAELLAVLQ
jgi:hypothetical protein